MDRMWSKGGRKAVFYRERLRQQSVRGLASMKQRDDSFAAQPMLPFFWANSIILAARSPWPWPERDRGTKSVSQSDTGWDKQPRTSSNREKSLESCRQIQNPWRISRGLAWGQSQDSARRRRGLWMSCHGKQQPNRKEAVRCIARRASSWQTNRKIGMNELFRLVKPCKETRKRNRLKYRTKLRRAGMILSGLSTRITSNFWKGVNMFHRPGKSTERGEAELMRDLHSLADSTKLCIQRNNTDIEEKKKGERRKERNGQSRYREKVRDARRVKRQNDNKPELEALEGGTLGEAHNFDPRTLWEETERKWMSHPKNQDTQSAHLQASQKKDWERCFPDRRHPWARISIQLGQFAWTANEHRARRRTITCLSQTESGRQWNKAILGNSSSTFRDAEEYQGT